MKKMTDEQLLKRVLFDKERYSIVVDNDVVWVQDNEKIQMMMTFGLDLMSMDMN